MSSCQSHSCQIWRTVVQLADLWLVTLENIGHDEIEEVKVIWEDRDAGCRVARPCHYPPFPMNGNPDQGELVLEVHTRKPKGAGRRGSAYSIVKEAFTLFMDDIDWARSTPYSVQEIKQAFGVEAAHLSMFRVIPITNTVKFKYAVHGDSSRGLIIWATIWTSYYRDNIVEINHIEKPLFEDETY